MLRAGGFSLDPRHLTGLSLYLGVSALVFVESGVLVAFLLPGDVVLFAAGLAAADPATHASAPLLAVAVSTAAVAGNVLAYLVGHRLGRPVLLRRYGARLGRAEALVGRFGALAVIVARFVPWARTFVPHLCGAAAMPWPRFLAATGVGAVTGGGGLVLLGALAARTPLLRHAALAVAVTVVAVSLAVPVLARRRGR